MTKELKAHLMKCHNAEAARHVRDGNTFSKIAEEHSACAKSHEVSNPTLAAHHSALAEHFVKISADHASDCESCQDDAKAVDGIAVDHEGAEGSSDLKIILDTLQKMNGSGLPAGFSLVPRTDKPTLHPRHGQPLPSEKTIDPALEHIVYDQT